MMQVRKKNFLDTVFKQKCAAATMAITLMASIFAVFIFAFIYPNSFLEIVKWLLVAILIAGPIFMIGLMTHCLYQGFLNQIQDKYNNDKS